MRIVLFFILFISFSGFSQLKTEVSKDVLHIGQRFKITLKVNLSNTKDSIQHIIYFKEIPINKINEESKAKLEIEKTFTDTIENNTWKGVYDVSAWDTGVFVLPKFQVFQNDQLLLADSIQIKVVELKNNTDYNSIIEEEIKSKGKFWRWIKKYAWVLLIPILIALVLYYFKSRKKSKPVKVSSLSIKDKYLLALSGLKNAQLWLKKGNKVHYSELTILLKSYLSEQLNLSLKETTTYECIVMLKKKNCSFSLVEKTEKLLSYADLIKFAKASPNESDILFHLHEVEQLIHELSPKINENEQ